MAIQKIDYALCDDCGVCKDICPMDVFGKVGRLYYIAHPKECMTCYLCEMDCTPNAIYVGAERAQTPVFPY